MFTDRQRQVYQTPDGRQYDPLRVNRKLWLASAGKFNEHMDRWASDDPLEQARGEEAVVAAAREAFGLDATKVLDAVVLETLGHFLEWLEGKDSPAASLPISWPPRGDSPAGQPATSKRTSG